MSFRPRIVAAVLLKDLRALWPVVAGAAALAILPRLAPNPAWAIVLLLAGVASAVGMVLAIQQDSMAGARVDVLTRPVGRLELFTAKWLFLVGPILTPWLVQAVIADIQAHHFAREILAERGAWAFGLLMASPLVIAAAAATESVVGTLALLIAAGLAALGLNALGFGFPASVTNSPAMSWMLNALLLPMVLVAGVFFAVLAFRARRARLVIGLTVGLPAALILIPNFFSSPRLAWSAHAAALPETAASRRVALSIEPGCFAPGGPESGGGAALKPGQVSVMVARAAAFTGLAPGQRLFLDRRTSLYEGKSPYQWLGKSEGLPFAVHDFDDYLNSSARLTRPAGSDGVVHHPDADHVVIEGLQAGDPSRLIEPFAPRTEWIIRATVLTPDLVHDLPADGMRHRIPGFGYCRVRPGALFIVDCYSPGIQPDLVTATYAGEPWDPCDNCQANYRPALFEIPGGRRYALNLRKPQAAAASIRLTTYRASARIERRTRLSSPPGGPAGRCPPLVQETGA